MTRPLVSIVIPFYNEESCLAATFAEVQAVEKKLSELYLFEYLLMDNHSTDGSREISLQLCREFPNVRYFRHSRNFGFQANILAGFRNARGAAAVQLDADGEDDPRLIEAFLEKWQQGYKVVYGVRKVRRESWALSAQRKIFYRILSYASEIPIPLDAGDFRLIDRKVIDFLANANEHNIYLRGLIAYAGFAQIGIEYERRPRHSGVSKFNWFSYLGLATTGLTGFSKRPLVLITYVGLLLCGLSLLLSLFYVFLFIFHQIPVRGFTTLVLLQLFFAGVILMSIGITALYVGRIFDEVKSRPHYIFEETA